ncbi:glutaredoxin 3 [Neisseria chenwenguii]|uniref:Glutaredoxin n=1 Tax=Neisseria chenwenguii TaxID=1853278 RepID=A0A220S3L1_9NEIS|nr:glutaredoxin 3 [Neisseria chenwenguii]ASK28070.1 glutaredoxin 3 [Neisseria chenwenguii]ROV57220.1 glutaredoxin 3 [Neisseria chenwenguii]
MQTVTMYSGLFCPYCTMAKKLLAEIGVTEINEIRIDQDTEKFAEMQQRSGRRSIPQIFIGDTHVGGFTDLHKLQQEGRLDSLLNP